METTLRNSISILFGRRSIRVFKAGDVPESSVQLLLEAAMAAPSACAKDSWRFVVIRDRSRLQQLADALPNGKMLAAAAIGIFVCGDLEAAHDRQLSFLLQDCAAAIENLLIAAHGIGLGACWLGVHPREERIARVRQLLALPNRIMPVSGIAIGRPGETKEPRTRFNPKYVHQEQWSE